MTQQIDQRPPLPIGTLIEFCGEEGRVLFDNGGDRVTVALDSVETTWRWEFEGTCCSVVAFPPNQA